MGLLSYLICLSMCLVHLVVNQDVNLYGIRILFLFCGHKKTSVETLFLIWLYIIV